MCVAIKHLNENNNDIDKFSSHIELRSIPELKLIKKFAMGNVNIKKMFFT